jgi:hypothetical protein
MDVRGGAKLTTESGDFIGNVHAIYVLEGELAVNGGFFKVQQPYSAAQPYDFTLNCYDANYRNGTAKITVNGGSFYGFDPQDNAAEPGGHVDETGEGFVAIRDGEGNYVVQEGWNVTFDANGGTPAPDAQRVAAGGKATEPTAPARAADANGVYAFAGWFAEGASEAYDFGTVLSGDLALTAHYTKVSVGGVAGLDTDSLAPGQDVGTLVPITGIEGVEIETAGIDGWKVTFKPVLKEGVAAAQWLLDTFAEKKIVIKHAAALADLVANDENVVATAVDGELPLKDETAAADGSISVVVPVPEVGNVPPSAQFFRLVILDGTPAGD